MSYILRFPHEKKLGNANDENSLVKKVVRPIINANDENSLVEQHLIANSIDL